MQISDSDKITQLGTVTALGCIAVHSQSKTIPTSRVYRQPGFTKVQMLAQNVAKHSGTRYTVSSLKQIVTLALYIEHRSYDELFTVESGIKRNAVGFVNYPG